MKKIITERHLHNIVKRSLLEAMKYDKGRRQYFPDYTGNKHSDAGKYAAKNRDDFEYSRNDYEWSDPMKQKRFHRLQSERDMEIDPFDMPDNDNEYGAEKYLNDRDSYQLVDKATEEMIPTLYKMIDNLYQQATQKYPILKQDYYKSDFIHGLQRAFGDYGVY